MFDIKSELNRLPKEPGVYIMLDDQDQVIYVGKAISLRNRVRQYFQSSKNQHPKVRAMVSHIKRFEYIIVDNEIEALILEANLIKKHKPKYNILLRDDKQYPYIKISYGEKFPRVLKTRKVLKDKAKYFGPYPSVYAVNDTIEIIRDEYPIRNCNQKLDKDGTIKRPCLNFHIRKCLGPCQGFKYHDQYMEKINEIDRFLSGKDDRLLKLMEERMNKASEALDFEKAAVYRDKLKSLEIMLEKQKIVNRQDIDQDIIGMARGIEEVCIQIFFVRNGKILGREHFIIEDVFDTDREEVLESFIKQFYIGTAYIPRQILIETEIKEKELIEDWLSEKRQGKVDLLVPQRGEKTQLIAMVKNNALNMLKRHGESLLDKKDSVKEGLEELEKLLSLEKSPRRIEAFDISNIQGTDSVGSMVVFENGRPKKSDYRRFKIRTVEGPDDYKSMEEVLKRRFIRGLEEKDYIDKKSMDLKGFSIFPDLILMDGGKGQVNVAKLILDSLGLDIPVAGLVKDDSHTTRGIIYENKEISLADDSQGFKLIYRIQEEAHRFAISFHRSLRSSKLYKSELDYISGVGPKRKANLFKEFKTIDGIRKASVEELQGVEGMNKPTAEKIYHYFRKENKDEIH